MISTNPNKDEILKLLKEEKGTPKSLSKEYNIPLQTIYTWLRTEKKNSQKVLENNIVSLYKEEKKTPKEICDELGVDLGTIYNLLNHSRIEIREEDMIRLEGSERERFHQSQLDTIRLLNSRIKELEEQNKVLQDSLKYLTELLNIKNGENKPQ